MKLDPCLSPVPKKSGRPLSFDRDLALERAMLVFWRFGYEAASLQQLTAAMGITPPSLYAAFGDKEKLFLEAIARYAGTLDAQLRAILSTAPSARVAIERVLQSKARNVTCPSHPPGCMVVTAATNCSAATEHVQDLLMQRRCDLESLLCECIEGGVRSGELGPDTNAAVLAGFYTTVMHGMSTQARDYRCPDKLLAIAAVAMQAWPALSAAGNRNTPPGDACGSGAP